jgi:hypothetical protein
MALLLPDILRLGTERERLAIYGLSFVAAVFGLAQVARFAAQYGSSTPYAQDGSSMPYEMVRNALSVAGLTLAAILGLTWRILLRDYESRPLTQTVCATE